MKDLMKNAVTIAVILYTALYAAQHVNGLPY